MVMNLKTLMAASLVALGTASASNAAIVISEVYGGGGKSGAPLNRDFVELFNNGTGTENIGDLLVQYSSATGTTFSTFATLPADTMLGAQSYYVIGVGPTSGTVGSSFTSDFSGSTGTNVSATAGKVQLLSGTTVLDLVGFGATANAFETSPAPAGSNTTSIQRTAAGLLDTQNNSVDFTSLLAPTPGTGPVAVPEPASLGLLAIGGLAALRRRRA